MTYDEKINRLLADRRCANIRYDTIIPPVYQLLWRLGFKPPPPLLARFWSVLLSLTLFFGLSCGVFASCLFNFMFWLMLGQPVTLEGIFSIVVVVAFLAGPPFGLAMAARYWWLRRRSKLPRWKDYPVRAELDPRHH